MKERVENMFKVDISAKFYKSKAVEFLPRLTKEFASEHDAIIYGESNCQWSDQYGYYTYTITEV